MKIVTWNCLGPGYAGELGKWQEKIKWLKKSYKADLYVIQECSKLQTDNARREGVFKYAAWYGDDIDYFVRGTAIFSDERCFTEREEFFHNPKFRYVVPYRIQFEDLDFILFNVWTKGKPQNPEYENQAYLFYENNVKEAMCYYNMLNDNDSYGKIFEMPKSSLLIGDFNFGKDATYVRDSFGKLLKEKYNFTIAQGFAANIDTYISYKDKKYFNDYCFSKGLNVTLMERGEFSEIDGKSDHIPLLFEVEKLR